MMTMEDIGHMVEKILKSKPANTRGHTGKPVRPVGDKVMRKELAACLHENLSPLRFEDRRVSFSSCISCMCWRRAVDPQNCLIFKQFEQAMFLGIFHEDFVCPSPDKIHS